MSNNMSYLYKFPSQIKLFQSIRNLVHFLWSKRGFYHFFPFYLFDYCNAVMCLRHTYPLTVRHLLDFVFNGWFSFELNFDTADSFQLLFRGCGLTAHILILDWEIACSWNLKRFVLYFSKLVRLAELFGTMR